MKSIGLLSSTLQLSSCGLARDVTPLQTEPSMNGILDGKNEVLYMDPRCSTVIQFCVLNRYTAWYRATAASRILRWLGKPGPGAELKKAIPSNCFQVNQTSTGVYVVVFKFTPPLRGVPICNVNQIFPVSFD